MSLRRTLLTLALTSVTLLSGCALRPHYRELVQPGAAKATAGELVVLRVVDPATGRPIPGAKVMGGELRDRLSTVTDANGEVQLKVSKVLLDENPLVEVVLPKGVAAYRFELVPSGQAPAVEQQPVSEQPAQPDGPTGASDTSATGTTEGTSTPASTTDAGT